MQDFPGTPGQYIAGIYIPAAQYIEGWVFEIDMDWRGRSLEYPRWPPDDMHDEVQAEFAAEEKCFGNTDERAVMRQQEQEWWELDDADND